MYPAGFGNPAPGSREASETSGCEWSRTERRRLRHPTPESRPRPAECVGREATGAWSRTEAGDTSGANPPHFRAKARRLKKSRFHRDFLWTAGGRPSGHFRASTDKKSARPAARKRAGRSGFFGASRTRKPGGPAPKFRAGRPPHAKRVDGRPSHGIAAPKGGDSVWGTKSAPRAAFRSRAPAFVGRAVRIFRGAAEKNPSVASIPAKPGQGGEAQRPSAAAKAGARERSDAGGREERHEGVGVQPTSKATSADRRMPAQRAPCVPVSDDCL